MRKIRTGSVVGTSMTQTAVVEMVWKQRNRLYRKQMRRVTRFYVHDPEDQCRVGDTVRIQETRPISKTKHWRLLGILHRRQVADIQPIELETDLDAEIAGNDDDDTDDDTDDENTMSVAVADSAAGAAGEEEAEE